MSVTLVLLQLGVTPLPDNHPMDKYFYQILVFTGFRKESGTSSKVRERTEFLER